MSDAERPVPTLYPLRFWSRVAILSALGCGLGVAALRWVFWQDLGQGYAEAFHTLRNLNRFLVPALLLSLLLVLMAASAALVAFAVFSSHRIAGPLFRLQRVGDHLSRRTLIGTIHLRQKDWVKPLSGAINAWVSRKKEFYKESTDWAETVDTALFEAKHAAGAGDAAQARQLLARVPPPPASEPA